MSVYTFIVSSGGSIGLLAGGVLTQSLSWHWIFFINVPIGILTFVLGRALITETDRPGLGQGVDVLGALLVTVALMLGVYAIVKATEYGWVSAHTLGFGARVRSRCSAAFVAVESRIEQPDVPAADPARAGAGRLERRTRLPGHRDVLDLPARGAVPAARARLRRARDRVRVPAADADHGRDVARASPPG